MKPKYDYLFVTHLPAFYKVNLYNLIAKQCRVFVIFIAKSSRIRAPDFTKCQFDFDYCILNQKDFEKRKVIPSLFRLWKLLQTFHFHKMVVGGWDLAEYWFLVCLFRRKKNLLALESSVFESATKGMRSVIKKLFLSRICLVFSSGEGHIALLNALSYTGNVKKTLGVGIFNYHPKMKAKKHFEGKFLYVGRLAAEKNLLMLVAVFAQLPQFSLTLVGSGPLFAQLEILKTPNVTLTGHVPNELLTQEYQQHNVFILPSLREPWGLVIEEALYHGLPVIVSDQVGCAKDIVSHWQTGILFSPYDDTDLRQAILSIQENYDDLIDKIDKIDFEARDAYQVQQYVESLS
jgi:glycosyltransferase involved in cell wall biosynthesis